MENEITAQQIERIIALSRRPMSELTGKIAMLGLKVDMNTITSKSDAIAILESQRGTWYPAPKPDNSDIMSIPAIREMGDI